MSSVYVQRVSKSAFPVRENKDATRPSRPELKRRSKETKRHLNVSAPKVMHGENASKRQKHIKTKTGSGGKRQKKKPPQDEPTANQLHNNTLKETLDSPSPHSAPASPASPAAHSTTSPPAAVPDSASTPSPNPNPPSSSSSPTHPRPSPARPATSQASSSPTTTTATRSPCVPKRLCCCRRCSAPPDAPSWVEA